MRKVIATEWMTLDGVVQSPSYPDEDRSGDFDRGGWHSRYFDDVSMSRVVETVVNAGGYLRLVESQATSTGAILATYAADEGATKENER